MYRYRFGAVWRAVGICLIAAVIVLSLIPSPPQIPGDGENWIGHVLAYSTLMGWFARLTPAWRNRIAFAVAFCLLGIGLEFLQGMTDYRSYDPQDMLVNAVGVIVGWIASPPRTPSVIVEVDAYLARWLSRT